MADIEKATNWQAHSARGFISGTVGKKMGLAIESTKNSAGDRCYRIAGSNSARIDASGREAGGVRRWWGHVGNCLGTPSLS